MKNIEIFLIRHGQTEFNLAGKIQGWCDSPLTEQGILGAQRLGEYLRNTIFQAAFSSDLPRAYHTAQLILSSAGQNLPVQCLSDLREYHFGHFEQGSVHEMHRTVGKLRGFQEHQEWLNAYHHHPSHNMLLESIHQLDNSAETETSLLERLMRALHTAVESLPQKQGRILMVSHGMAIATLLKHFIPEKTLYQSPPNTSISKLVFDGQTFQVLSFAETISS